MINKKSNLAKRYATSYESKKGGISTRKGIMNFSGKEVEFFKPVEGKNRINIIPYEIKNKNHPLVKNGTLEVGDWDYLMDIFTHRFIGANGDSVVCLKRNFGKPCPICEQEEAMRKQGKDKEAQALRPSRRVYYNIQDLADEGKVKVFETSYALFEKEMIEEAKDDEAEGGYIDFASPDDGKEVRFRGSPENFAGKKYLSYKAFNFADRDEPVTEDVLEKAISFDECLNIMTYEEIEKVLYGQDEDEAPKSTSYEEDEEDLSTAAYTQAPKKSFDDMEDEDDEPKKVSGECPYGHRYGKDNDETSDCDKCDKWEKCLKASQGR